MTSAPVLYLLASALGLVFTAVALVRVRRLAALSPLIFAAAWPTDELAPFHIAWQALATAGFAAAGAFEAPAGWLGLGITLLSWTGLLAASLRARPTGEVAEAALSDALGPDYRQAIPASRRADLREDAPLPVVLRPFSMRRPGVEVVRDIAYGDAGKRNRLDIYKPEGAGTGRPVLLQIHGGGWVIGEKEQQALPLMYHLAERGWVCVAVNYQLSPKVRFPQHLIDVKRALAWVRENIAEFGGDPSFVAVTGGSAGGHLSSLVALTAGDVELQPGFEEADTRVAACVPFYGIYDFLDRKGVRGESSMRSFAERFVMPASPDEDPKVWDLASPVTKVRPDAPPFFVVHGTHDSLAYVEDARLFVETLRSVSRGPVGYAELPGAQHAFDVFHSIRSAHTVNAVTRFLEWAHATRSTR